MKNRKGFTLVELLAVIAILAILILIALPNVIGMYNEAKKNSFITEVRRIFETSEKEWISDSIFETKERVYAKNSDSKCTKELDLSGRKNIEYFVRLNKSGQVVEYYVSDGSFQYQYNLGEPLKIDQINKVEEVSNLPSDRIIDINCDSVNNSSYVDAQGEVYNTNLAEACASNSAKYKNGAYNCLDWAKYLPNDSFSGTDVKIITSNTLELQNSISFSGKTYTKSTEYDVSNVRNNQVILGLYYDNNDNALFIISQDGGVIAPPNLAYAFAYRSGNTFKKLSYVDLTYLDTSNTNNMMYMFYNDTALERHIFGNSFNTSKVTDMKRMFYYNKDVSDLDFHKFDTSNVVDMSAMFMNTGGFNTLDFSLLDTSKVKKMSYFFSRNDLTNFDMNKIDTSAVEDMSYMFSNATNLDKTNISNLNTSAAIKMSNFFNACDLTNVDITGLDTHNVTSMNYMFYKTTGLDTVDFSHFNTSKVEDMSYMFYYTDATRLNLDSFDTHNVTKMNMMFAESTKMEYLDLKAFDTSNVTTMAGMFMGTSYSARTFFIDVTGWNTSKVTTMESMFDSTGRECTTNTGKIVGLETFDTHNVTIMNNIFYCTGQMSTEAVLNVSSWDVSNVTEMHNMFYGAMYRVPNIDLDLSGWNTSKVWRMVQMFWALGHRSNTIKLNISNFDLSHVNSFWGTFAQIGYNKNAVMEMDVSNIDFTSLTQDFPESFTYTTNKLKIIVKDEANKEWFIRKFSRFNDSNVIIKESE